jgi:dihydroxyacetone kinase
MTARNLINDPHNVVDEYLEGFLDAHSNTRV